MKKILILIATMFLMGGMAMAQVPMPPAPQQPHHQQQPHRGDPHHTPGYPMPGPGAPMPARVASPDQVAAIVKCMRDESFDDRRMSIAKLSVYICPVPVTGLRNMAEVFTFDDRRLEFLEYAYAFCPDRENYWHLCDAFTFRSNAEKMCHDLGIRY